MEKQQAAVAVLSLNIIAVTIMTIFGLLGCYPEQNLFSAIYLLKTSDDSFRIAFRWFCAGKGINQRCGNDPGDVVETHPETGLLISTWQGDTALQVSFGLSAMYGLYILLTSLFSLFCHICLAETPKFWVQPLAISIRVLSVSLGLIPAPTVTARISIITNAHDVAGGLVLQILLWFVSGLSLLAVYLTEWLMRHRVSRLRKAKESASPKNRVLLLMSRQLPRPLSRTRSMNGVIGTQPGSQPTRHSEGSTQPTNRSSDCSLPRLKRFAGPPNLGLPPTVDTYVSRSCGICSSTFQARLENIKDAEIIVGQRTNKDSEKLAELLTTKCGKIWHRDCAYRHAYTNLYSKRLARYMYYIMCIRHVLHRPRYHGVASILGTDHACAKEILETIKLVEEAFKFYCQLQEHSQTSGWLSRTNGAGILKADFMKLATLFLRLELCISVFRTNWDKSMRENPLFHSTMTELSNDRINTTLQNTQRSAPCPTAIVHDQKAIHVFEKLKEQSDTTYLLEQGASICPWCRNDETPENHANDEPMWRIVTPGTFWRWWAEDQTNTPIDDFFRLLYSLTEQINSEVQIARARADSLPGPPQG